MAASQNAGREPTKVAIVGESDHIVAETAARVLAYCADPKTINRAKDGVWRGPLWRALSEAGLPLAWVPEQLGGSGANFADGFAVLGAAGRFAVAMPLAETLLAGWLLARAGLASPDGAMTVAPARPLNRITLGKDGTLSGRALGVPFASDTPHIAVIAEYAADAIVALVAAKDCEIDKGLTPAGDASNVVVFDRVKPLRHAPAPVGFDNAGLMIMGSVVRSVQTAGALEAILSLSVAYANERIAFERPIGKFQAVQQNLARLAGE